MADIEATEVARNCKEIVDDLPHHQETLEHHRLGGTGNGRECRTLADPSGAMGLPVRDRGGVLMAGIGCGRESSFRRLIPLLALTLLAACQSAGIPGGAKCEPRRGMTTAQLVACDCVMEDSGGAAIAGATGDAPRKAVTVADFACPVGKAGFAQVSVVDGVVREVY